MFPFGLSDVWFARFNNVEYFRAPWCLNFKTQPSINTWVVAVCFVKCLSVVRKLSTAPGRGTHLIDVNWNVEPQASIEECFGNVTECSGVIIDHAWICFFTHSSGHRDLSCSHGHCAASSLAVWLPGSLFFVFDCSLTGFPVLLLSASPALRLCCSLARASVALWLLHPRSCMSSRLLCCANHFSANYFYGPAS